MPFTVSCFRSIYLGCEQDLPEWRWRLTRYREISVYALPEEQPEISSIFSKPHVYHVSSTATGDGCGFGGESEHAQRARDELAAFLDSILAVEPELEMFVRQINVNATSVSPARFDKVSPNDIRTWRTFHDDEFLSIVRDE
jgi:hypothetical protein